MSWMMLNSQISFILSHLQHCCHHAHPLPRNHKSRDTPPNIWAQAEDRELDHYLTRGIYQTDLLTVRGFKIYCDGALGSRGA